MRVDPRHAHRPSPSSQRPLPEAVACCELLPVLFASRMMLICQLERRIWFENFCISLHIDGLASFYSVLEAAFPFFNKNEY